MIDLLIVGGGAAGCAAALTARKRNLDTVMIYAGDGALGKAHLIDNYPGTGAMEGKAMLDAMRRQAKEMGVDLRQALATKILPTGGGFSVLAGNDILEAKAVLLACGVARVKTLENEEALLGQGVSYCATCDGMFYKGKEMLVVGASEEAVEEANYLAELGHVIYFSETKHDLSGLSSAITVREEKPAAVRRENGRMVLSAGGRDFAADGIFVMRPVVAMTQLLPELDTEKGAVKVDKDMATNVPGVYAAGDMTGNPLQVAKAVGEGNIAALAIANYLKKLGESAL